MGLSLHYVPPPANATANQQPSAAQPSTKQQPKLILSAALLRSAEDAGISRDMLKALGHNNIKCEEWLAKFITVDKAMLAMKRMVLELSEAKYFTQPVLIYGETGTGKELVARALHGDTNGNFVAVNCTSLPLELFESELFGHVEGAFTGASKQKVGLFQHAQNGTLFLDEIGRMPQTLQAKLLRTIQQRTIRKVGSNTEEKVNVRVIAASQYPLENNEHILQDLYWRLASYTIQLTPLRERPGDVYEIIDDKFPAHNLTQSELDEIALSPLRGNVREVECRVRRLLLTKLLQTKAGTEPAQ